MKHTRHILLMAAMLLGCFSVSAEVVQIDGIWYNVVKKAKLAEVVADPDGTYYSGDIVIPSVVEYEGVECSVTSIGYGAFAHSYGADITITSVSIPESVTSIGDDAFFHCFGLTSVSIPGNVTSIGYRAFYDCSSLTSITLSEGVTKIAGEAFRDCVSLTSITIPENVTSIEDYTFGNCKRLTTITIPKSVTSIGKGAFSNCSCLSSIIIPENSQLTSIGMAAFVSCSSLAEISIPESVTSIGEAAFNSCSSLTSITIPESVTSIGGLTFYGCSSLTSISIPESMTSIESALFKDCNKLTTIVLPKSLKQIHGSAFANCSELLDVYCYAEQVPSMNESAFENSYPEYITLRVPLKALDSYKSTAPWNSFGKIESLEVAVAEISLSQTSATLTEGESLILSASVAPENAEDKSISWSSSDFSIANVDVEGKVTATGPGTAIITATANDGSGVSDSCEVIVSANLRDVTFMVDGQVYDAEIAEDGTFPEAPEKEGYTFKEWQREQSEALQDVDLKNNADAMLYTNAPCTNTQWGDQFVSWNVLFDGDASTIFHSEYSDGVDSKDGLDHYLRVDMGEDNAVKKFSFTYTVRKTIPLAGNYSPSKMIVEGANAPDGPYTELASLANLPRTGGDVYQSPVISNGTAYRYIRFRVTETYMNVKVQGHPYFFMGEFGMKANKPSRKTVYHAIYTLNTYKVYYYVGEELVNTIDVPYGQPMPEYTYEPTDNTEEFLGWSGDTYETMPAHDVTYVADIRTLEKCATPTIGYADGRMTFSCETEGVEFRTRVIDENRLSYRTDSDGFEFVPTYTFTTRATKEDCIDSDEVSITICWIDCTGKHESDDEDTGIISVPSQPVIIQCANGVITLTGLADGTEVVVYDTASMKQGTAEVENGVATIATNLTAGSTAIVKMGNRSVKVMIK